MKRLMAITVISLTIFGCKKENKNSTPPTAGPDPAPVVVDSSKIYDKIDTFKGSVNGHYENYAAGYIHKDTLIGEKATFISGSFNINSLISGNFYLNYKKNR